MKCDLTEPTAPHWCPGELEDAVGFAYEVLNDRCERLTRVCDYGLTGSLTYGCDTLLTPDSGSDVDTWGLYDADCFDDYIVPAEYTDVYDTVCCEGSLINNFNMYQDNVGNIVVY